MGKISQTLNSLLLLASACLAVTTVPSSALAHTFKSCSDLAAYLESVDRRKLDPYAKALKLEEAANQLKEDESLLDCTPPLVGRARFDYADALDKFARTFSASSTAARNWSLKAAKAFEDYLDWFRTLPADRIDVGLRSLKNFDNLSEEQFAKERAQFLRGRVGNALNSMIQSYVRVGDYNAFFDALEEATQLPVEVFPKEVVAEWYKWLRSHPDFKRERDRDDEVVASIKDSEKCHDRWRIFASFLEKYAQQGRPQRERWATVQTRVAAWL